MKQIELPPRGLETLFGVHDQNIKYLESLLDVRIDARTGRFHRRRPCRRQDRRTNTGRLFPNYSARDVPSPTKNCGKLLPRLLRIVLSACATISPKRVSIRLERSRSRQSRQLNANTSRRFRNRTLSSVSASPALAKPIWRWRWPCRP